MPLTLAVVTLVALPATTRAPSSADPGRGWTISSPGNTISATVAAHSGTYEIDVSRGGRNVLAATLGGRPGTAVGAPTQDTVRDAYTTPTGKRRSHQLAANRLTVAFAHGRSLQLLVADDGVAFRQTGAGNDDASWRAPAGAKAWLQTFRPDYEGPYEGVPLRKARYAAYGFPALLQTGGGWALLTESGLTKGPAARLAIDHGKPGVLRVALPRDASLPRTTAWRVAVVGDLGTVVGSDLPMSLGRPSQIRDTSWIKPGRVAWSWWSDTHSPGNLWRQRAFVRAAAAYHWEYVLLDAGWNPRDVPRIAAYARSKGVRIMVWTSWKALRDPARRERLLEQWASWGVAGVKVDFLLSDKAGRIAMYDAIARDAARHHLAVVFHGCTVPRGIQRTWPNVLTMEAVEGAEREIPDQGTQAMDPHQDVNLVFTRNAIGSMDYTPVTFSASNRDSTDAHRLALAVVYESGLQHFADSPEAYARHPKARQVLTDVPTAWDDTRLLAGAPDVEAVVARRSSERWWVGSISAAPAHRQRVLLGFLAPGRRYALHLVRDNGSGGLAAEDRTVTSADSLTVAVERHGGFTAELTPQP
jgi:alpha-glucosidase